MLLVYVGALLASAGTIALQVFGGHDGNVDASHDVHAGDGSHDPGFWLIFASLRFWAFAFFAFGMVGTLATFFHLAGPAIVLATSIASGFASGSGAAIVVRRLNAKDASSHKSTDEIVGKLGRVIVPLGGAPGKVRVEVKGTIGDYVARSSEAISEGETVLVEEFDGNEALVSRAPKDLEP